MKTPIMILLIVLASFGLLFRIDSKAGTEIKDERDQKLFLAGAKAISERRFDEGRILLRTMIYTYSESPLRGQAELLVFYSFAQEGGPRNENATKLLVEIQERMKAYEPKQRFQ
ncbi:MAG TPA: hypothetical protein VFV34_19280 [Blastocatellia bacterium]|nr:hypothetical protein [Blastocatellia bacterium]